MKNKIIIIILIILAVVIVGITGVYFSGYFSKNSEQNNLNNNFEKEDGQNKLVTDEFEINIPAGWIKAPLSEGIAAMAIASKENVVDPAAQKLNFKSYVAINHDIPQQKSMDEYIQAAKTDLQNNIPGVVISEGQDTEINGMQARSIEIEMVQQEAEFKVVLTVIKGNLDDFWVISFNTTKISWDSYKEIFSASVNSFKIKK
jgi:hypothetical protein